jgi:hypothetical protein
MPALTRRRSADRPDCWHIYYGDVHAGTIAKRVGNPSDTDPWEWVCGFYPGSKLGEIQSGTSATLDDARAEFASAWAVFLANRTTADFQAWRYQRDATAWKYAMWDRGFRLPTQTTSGRSKCFCGADLTVDGVTDHIRTAHSFKVDKSATAEYSAPSPRDHSGNA